MINHASSCRMFCVCKSRGGDVSGSSSSDNMTYLVHGQRADEGYAVDGGHHLPFDAETSLIQTNSVVSYYVLLGGLLLSLPAHGT